MHSTCRIFQAVAESNNPVVTRVAILKAVQSSVFPAEVSSPIVATMDDAKGLDDGGASGITANGRDVSFLETVKN